jgi:hypothetical protein
MKHLFFTLILTTFVSACGKDIKMPSEVDRKTDFSTQIVPDGEFKSYGCIIMATANNYSEVRCQNQTSLLEGYRQRLSAYRYERQLRQAIESGTIYTPSGQIVNKVSLDAIATKWQALYRFIHQPAEAFGDKRALLKFARLPEFRGNDQDQNALLIGIETLLEALMKTNIIVEIADDLSVQIAIQNPAPDEVKNFREHFLRYVEVVKNKYDLGSLPQTNTFVSNMLMKMEQL